MYAVENLKPKNFSFFKDMTDVWRDLLTRITARPAVMENTKSVKTFLSQGPWFKQIEDVVYKHTNITLKMDFNSGARWVAMMPNVDPKDGIIIEKYERNIQNKEFLTKDHETTVNYFIKTLSNVAGALDQYSSQIDLKELPHFFKSKAGPLMFGFVDPFMLTTQGYKETPFTAEEIAAAFLHEIGHTYGLYISMLFGVEAGITANAFSNYRETDPTVASTLKVLNDCLQIAQSLPDKNPQKAHLITELTNTIKDLKLREKDITREKLMALQWYACTLTGNISGTYIINSIFMLVPFIQNNLYPSQVGLKRMVGYQERFADRYAAQMGAAQPLATFFEKFYAYKKGCPVDQLASLYTGSLLVYWLDHIGFYGNPIIWLVTILEIAALPMGSPHENEVKRIEDILKSLYSQFSKEGINPEVKKVYAQQIEFIQETLDKIKNSKPYQLDAMLISGLKNVFLKGPIGVLTKTADFRARLNTRLERSHIAMDNPGYYHGYLLDQVIDQTKKEGKQNETRRN